jgi:hypothetical protein
MDSSSSNHKEKQFSLFDDNDLSDEVDPIVPPPLFLVDENESVQTASQSSLQTLLSIQPLKMVPAKAGNVFASIPRKADVVFLLDSSM